MDESLNSEVISVPRGSANLSVSLSPPRRPFPSSLRFLIQQHLDLLHALQERVLRCQWQGIVGDVFMKLGSKEVIDAVQSSIDYVCLLVKIVTLLSVLLRLFIE